MPTRFDDFNRADSASGIGNPSDGGAAWIADIGNLGISSNTAYAPTSQADAVSALECGASDGDVQYTLTTAGGGSGIVFRAVDGNNYWVCLTINFVVTFYKKVSGSFTNVGATYTGSVANGDVFRVNMAGGTLTVFQNGTQRVQITGQTDFTTATKHGMRISTDTTSRIDDFSAPSGGGGGSSVGADAMMMMSQPFVQAGGIF